MIKKVPLELLEEEVKLEREKYEKCVTDFEEKLSSQKEEYENLVDDLKGLYCPYDDIVYMTV
jgi:hypothetical protein